jgi:IclR helix-turn-helix domain
MARKKVSRSLGQLPHRSAIGRTQHKTARLLEILRGVATTNQAEQAQSFYSVREIAHRFRVPISTVSGIYRHLEHEGLLSRVRSSRTILQGLHYDRRLRVRAFVGLPACLSTFVTIQDYRTFFIRIRRELRLRGFATAMVFFKNEEARTNTLSDRLKMYEVDTVIWFLPAPSARETGLRLKDMGIRLIGVGDGRPSPIPCRYHVYRAKAIGELLAQWKHKYSVDKITVVESRVHRSATNEETVKSVLEELRIESRVAFFNSQRTETFLHALCRAKTGGLVFPSSALASMFCFRQPEAVTELLRLQRVALLDGPVDMPFTSVPDVQVDLATVDWQSVAKTIVDELTTQEAFRNSTPTIFEAQAQTRVPLSRFAENI